MLSDDEPARHERDDPSFPLCVALEGTLLKSDLLAEALVQYVKSNYLNAFLATMWLMRGRAHLKSQLTRRVSFDIDRLPVNTAFRAWLQSENQRGRRLILCAAGNGAIADQVAAHFKIFEATISSDSSGQPGHAMAEVLEERFGRNGFDYAGNELDDLPVWNVARRAIVVSPSFGLRRFLKRLPRLERIFQGGRYPAKLWFRALRIHQWSKNLLLFVPALASHRALEPTVAISAVLGFLWFSLCASSAYLINDLVDLEADRAHPRKKARPLASGELPLFHAMIGAALLMTAAILGAALTLGTVFVAVLLIYVVGTLWYSFVLKRIAMVDVLTLAGLYTVRVIAGGAAMAVVPSFWLLAFSMFMFLSLAMVKRYTELRSMLSMGRSAAAGRGYSTDDLPLLLSCGTSAGFVSILVLALYVNDGASQLYRYPKALWLLCPLILYWICRVWRKTHRGELHDDPIVFATRDKPSLLVACLCGILLWAAS